jgi:hypothetical protein
MRKNTLLASAAALSLFAATTIASAQSMNQGSPKGAEPPAAAAPKGESTAPATPPAAKPKQTQTNAPTAPGAKPGPTAQDQKAAPQQAQDKPAAQKAAPQQAQDKPAATSTQPKSATTPAADTKPSTTTGAAASGGTAAAGAPPAEKRGQIATAIKQEKIPAATNVNFNISVGARVPSTVTFYPVPTRIIEIYPEWRGYQVILVNGRYIIVRPQTYEIVYIIEG